MAKRKASAKKGSAKGSVKKFSLPRRILAVFIVGVILLISLPFTTGINRLLRLYTDFTTHYSGGSVSELVSVEASGSRLLVHFIDVGQGDATLIELPDGKTILIDGGKDKEKKKLLEYLNGVDEKSDTFNKVKDGGGGFDNVILTHADEDHCGGIDDVINAFGAKTFYRPNELSSYKGFSDPGKSSLTGSYSSQDTRAYSRAITAGYTAENIIINTSGLAITSELDRDSEDFYELIFYGPLSDSYVDRNDYSPVMILYFKGKKIAISGDAEKTAENEFYSAVQRAEGIFAPLKDKNFYADVIKAGHHGSKTSTGRNYLDVMTTAKTASSTIAIISCGQNNSYEHPHVEAINRLREVGILDQNIIRTDLNSTIVLSVETELIDGRYQNVIKTGAERIASVATFAIRDVTLDWPEIALAIFISSILFLIVEPMTKGKKGSGSKSKAKSRK